MSDRDEHLEVLRAMWGEMKTLNSRVNTTNERLEELREYVGARIDAVNGRLDGTNDRLDAQRGDLKEAIAIGRLDRKRLDRLELRVDALEQRAAAPAKTSRRPRR